MIGVKDKASFLRKGLFAKYVISLVGLVVFVLAVNGALETGISYRATKTSLTEAMSEKATATARRIERILGESLLQCLGRIAFSWYLWHWPLLVITALVVGHPLSWQLRLVVVWVSVAVAIGLS